MTVLEAAGRSMDINFSAARVFPSGLESVGKFRRMIGEKLGPDAVTATMVGSEIAANAAEHGTPNGETFVGGVDRLPGGKVVVFVADASPEPPVASEEEDLTGERGRGLAMVGMIAESWGHTAEIPDDIRKIAPDTRKLVYAITDP
jgi:two-component sensor histidine kinase